MAQKITGEKAVELAGSLGISMESFGKILTAVGSGLKTGRRSFTEKERVIRSQDTENPFPGVFETVDTLTEGRVTYYYPDITTEKGRMLATVKYVLAK